LPATQISSTSQRWPQSPQWRSFLRVSTQPPPQSRVPLGHIVVARTHALPLQIWPTVHAVPHAPQFVELDFVSTHAVPHLVRPGLQAHAPATQASLSAQTLPQSPQLLKSFCTSRHAPAQVFAVLGHAQAPPTHAGVPAPQVFPQPPQFRGSVFVSVHVPPHVVAPAAHAQTPEIQACALLQARVHEPQAAGSALRSRQVPPQLTIVPGHAPSTAGTASIGAGASDVAVPSVVVVPSVPGSVSEPLAVVSVVDESTSVVSAGASSSEPPHAVSAETSSETRTACLIMAPPDKDSRDSTVARLRAGSQQRTPAPRLSSRRRRLFGTLVLDHGQTPPVTQIGVFCVPIAGQHAVSLPRTLQVDGHGHVLQPTAGRKSSQLPRTQTSS